MIDCFMFFNELDLLEIRLNSLAPYVERFVLCESPLTHSGIPKPLYYEENKNRFKQFNICHLIYENGRCRDPWERENHQREFLMNGIQDIGPETVVLISDLDEIPDLEDYKGQEGVFRQKLYYYALNIFTGINNWKGTIGYKRKNVTSFQELRNRRNKLPSISKGWHFSTLGSLEQIREKIESFAHQELNTEEKKKRISENKKNLRDPYDRNSNQFKVEMPSGPKWLLKNKGKYHHLFYET